MEHVAHTAKAFEQIHHNGTDVCCCIVLHGLQHKTAPTIPLCASVDPICKHAAEHVSLHHLAERGQPGSSCFQDCPGAVNIKLLQPFRSEPRPIQSARMLRKKRVKPMYVLHFTIWLKDSNLETAAFKIARVLL